MKNKTPSWEERIGNIELIDADEENVVQGKTKLSEIFDKGELSVIKDFIKSEIKAKDKKWKEKVEKLEEDSSTLYGCGYNEAIKDLLNTKPFKKIEKIDTTKDSTIEERFKDKFVNNKKGTETGGILIEDTEELLDFIQSELKANTNKVIDIIAKNEGWEETKDYYINLLKEKTNENN